MDNLLIFGIPGAAIILVLIEIAKQYGLNSKWAPLLAIGLGVVLAVLMQLAEINPQLALWLKVAISGLLTGLSAVGLWSGGKTVITKLLNK